MLQTIRKDIRQTEAIVTDLTARIKEMLSPYQNVLELLKKISGLSSKTVGRPDS
jgi:nitrate reductase assembly molybdenum cofactor insertion protein NarJ